MEKHESLVGVNLENQKVWPTMGLKYWTMQKF